MIDIHTHIIPFVDDGSPSLLESLKMIKQSYESGVDTMIATPHHIYKTYVNSVDVITENFTLLKEAVEKEKIPIKLLLGQEIYYTSKENIIEKLNNKELLTMNNSNYVLLEFSFVKEPEDIFEVIYNFEINNYKVIIAHIERYEWMSLDYAIALKKAGALIQINSGSLLGVEGRKIKRLAKNLLKNNLVDFVASDIHSFRPSTLKESLKVVKNNALYNTKLFDVKEKVM